MTALDKVLAEPVPDTGKLGIPKDHPAYEARLQLWEALSEGKAVHLVNLASGVHRGWMTRDCEPGYEVERIGCRQLGARMGAILEAVRTGTTFEVVDHISGETRGYLTWCPPRAVAQDPDAPQSLLSYRVKRTALAVS